MQVNSPSVEFRQRSPLSGTKCVVEHMLRHFRLPLSFSAFIYVSQLVQALAMKTAVEHWRRLMPYCSGTLFWQLNDIWPGISWSAVEHTGRWKLLQHFCRRFYQPILLSSVEAGADADRELELWITNDQHEAHAGSTLAVRVVDVETGRSSAVHSSQLNIAPFSSKCVARLAVRDLMSTFRSLRSETDSGTSILVRLSLSDRGGTLVADNFHLFSPPKTLRLPKVRVSASVLSHTPGLLKLSLSSSAVALFVAVEAAGDDFLGRFSDSGFLLTPETPKILSFEYPTHHSLAEAAFLQSLRITTLRDSY